MSSEYDDSPETRRRLYEQTKAELISKQVANSTSYDTAILTLSSAFLALSVTFVKDVVAPLSEASLLWVLFASWFCYCGAIVSTVVSFMVGQAGYRELISAAERYYLKGDATAHQVSVVISKRIETLNIANGACFVFGTAFTLIFTVANFNRLAAMPTTKPSAPTPSIEHRGQPTLPFQQVPSAPAPRPASPPASTPAPPPAERRTGA
jgi:hypothetical protein